MSTLTKTMIDEVVKFKTIKDILLSLASILGTNLLLSVLVDVKSQNALVSDIITNDLIASPEFYESMTEDNKQKIYMALEKNIYDLNNSKYDMCEYNKKKIMDMPNDYYYEKCEYIITCEIKEGYIEKEVVKKLSLKSYNSEYEISGF